MTSLPFTFLGLDPVQSTFESSAAVVLPVPYDATTSYKTGAREGPHAIIAASRELEDYDLELEAEPSARGIYTAGALEPHLGSPQKMIERVQAAAKPIAESGKLLAMLGGDHSISIGAAMAMACVHSDISVLYLDAHADFRDEYQGTRWGHASSARRISEVCPIALVGVRSMALEEAQALAASDVKVYPAPFEEHSLSAIAGSLSQRVYVSVDLDVLDPSLMAAVGTPEPGGFDWYQLLSLLRSIAEKRRIVGFDVVELAPKEGPASCAFIAAKLVYKLIGYATVLKGAGA